MKKENWTSKIGLFIFVALFPIFVLAQNKPKRDRLRDNVGVKREQPQKVTSTPKNEPSVSSTQKKKTKSTQKRTTHKPKKETANPVRQEQYFSVSKDKIEVSERGGIYDISVSSSASWNIEIGTSHWIKMTRKGDCLHLVIEENTQKNTRTDYFKLSSGEKSIRVNITQNGQQIVNAQPRLELSSYTHGFSSERSSYEIVVSCDKEWDVSVMTASWAHLTRNGNKLMLTVDANTVAQSRDDYFCVKSGDIVKRFTLTQQGRVSNNTYSSTSNGSVMNSYSSIAKTNNMDSQYASYYIDKTSWWKDRIRLGWNILGYEMNDDILALKTGLRLRFGKHSDAFNLVLGCDYTCHAKYVLIYGNSWWSISDFDYYTILHQLSFNATIRFNLFKVGVSKFYIGSEFETGIKLADGKYSVENQNWPIAIAPQVGFNCKHFDFGLYYKRFINNYNLFNSLGDYKIGGFAVWYF